MNSEALNTIVDRSEPTHDVGLHGVAILPVQFHESRRRLAIDEGVWRLMSAVLADAIRCYQDNFAATQARRVLEFQEAREWFFSKEADGPFSFIGVCEALQLEPDAIRKRIREWQ